MKKKKMAEKIWKYVTKEEFDRYVKNYPRKLRRDVYAAVEPPSISYHDFEIGEAFDSIIASTLAYSDNPNDYYYMPESERTYRILENYKDFLEKSD